MQWYIRDRNQRGYLFEVTEDVRVKLKTLLYLGVTKQMIQSPCVLEQTLMLQKQKFQARGDFQAGNFKCAAEYHGDDTWLVLMWVV